MIAQAAANNLIPATLELGGKSPNIFFADVMDKDDGFLDKAIEGLVLFAFNQGEVCTCPSRALIQESIYDKFMERCLARVAAIKQGSPLDTDTMMGAQASKEQLAKIMSYLDLGKQEGAEVLIGGDQAHLEGELAGGYYIQPTLFKGHNKMRIFQEEIFGPVLSVLGFTDIHDAVRQAKETAEAANRAKIRAEVTPQYQRSREAKDTADLRWWLSKEPHVPIFGNVEQLAPETSPPTLESSRPLPPPGGNARLQVLHQGPRPLAVRRLTDDVKAGPIRVGNRRHPLLSLPDADPFHQLDRRTADGFAALTDI